MLNGTYYNTLINNVNLNNVDYKANYRNVSIEDVLFTQVSTKARTERS